MVSGVLMGLWSPVHDLWRDATGHPLTSYSSVVFLTLGALLSCFIWNIYFMKKPLVGEPVSFAGFFSGPPSGHLLGLLGGASGARARSSTLRREIYGQSPFRTRSGNRRRWWERCGAFLRGRNSRARDRGRRLYLTLMFVFYALAILLVARANG